MPTLDEIADDPGQLVTAYEVLGVREFPPRIILRCARVNGETVTLVLRPEVSYRMSDDLLRSSASALRPAAKSA